LLRDVVAIEIPNHDAYVFKGPDMEAIVPGEPDWESPVSEYLELLIATGTNCDQGLRLTAESLAPIENARAPNPEPLVAPLVLAPEIPQQQVQVALVTLRLRIEEVVYEVNFPEKDTTFDTLSNYIFTIHPNVIIDTHSLAATNGLILTQNNLVSYVKHGGAVNVVKNEQIVNIIVNTGEEVHDLMFVDITQSATVAEALIAVLGPQKQVMTTLGVWLPSVPIIDQPGMENGRMEVSVVQKDETVHKQLLFGAHSLPLVALPGASVSQLLDFVRPRFGIDPGVGITTVDVATECDMPDDLIFADFEGEKILIKI